MLMQQAMPQPQRLPDVIGVDHRPALNETPRSNAANGTLRMKRRE